ncbi:MAG: glycosyltransferase family 4 protein [Acidobacteriota bacterium]
MRITCVISSLSCGGSERIMSGLVARLAARDHEVHLITLASRDADFYAIDSRVQRTAMDLAREPRHVLDAAVNNLRRWRRLRHAVREIHPQVVLSFMAETNILTLAACARLKIPVVVSERVDPRYSPIGRLRERLRRWLYPRASAVVVQTGTVRNWIAEAFRLDTVRVIANAVEPPEDPPATIPGLPAGARFILGMGRLTRQKGFDLLLQAFARCAVDHEGWWLLLLGDGEERAELLRQGELLGITDRLKLLGRQLHPAGILRRGDLFVLPSRFEGFPNALLEAMACGLPVIAADCPSGPADIIRPGRDGVLVPAENVDALTEAMVRLMGDEEECERLGRAALQVQERFSINKSVDQWEQVLREAVGGHRPMIRGSRPRSSNVARASS